MKSDQLRQIIQNKNDHLEYAALKSAGEIIESIAREQQTIVTCHARIAPLRAELKTLEVEKLDASEILGAA